MTPHDSPREAFGDQNLVLQALLGLHSLSAAAERLAEHGVPAGPEVVPAPSDPALLAILGAISLGRRTREAIDGLRGDVAPIELPEEVRLALRELLR